MACHNLSVQRGAHRALDDVSVTVPQRRITGLLGPSGCGKSTLMRAIVGTQRSVAGQIEIFGLPAGSPALRGKIGYVTQAASVYPDLTVVDNVAYFARLAGLRSDELAGAVVDALAAVDLSDESERLTQALSGGQRNRVSIACALVGAPPLLILDEPTVGLDPVLRADLWRRLRRLADAGTTLLVSSHVMDEADQCDALILLREGQIVAELTPQQLRDRTGESRLEQAFLTLIEEAA